MDADDISDKRQTALDFTPDASHPTTLQYKSELFDKDLDHEQSDVQISDMLNEDTAFNFDLKRQSYQSSKNSRFVFRLGLALDRI